MLTYKLDEENQSKTINYLSQEKSPDINDDEPIIANYFKESSDLLLTFIILTAMAENDNLILSDDDCHFLDSSLDDPIFSYRAIILLNKLLACEHNPFVKTPIFLYEHLFQLLERDQSNVIFSTIGNCIAKSDIFAEYAIENDIIIIYIHKYSNVQQDMIPWIAKCFLFHQEMHIINKIYSLIDNIMENIASICFNPNVDQEIANNYIINGFQVLTQFMIKTQNYKYFFHHYCFSRNITICIDNNECQYEQFNFIYSLTKNLQDVPINFPCINFFNLAKTNLLNLSGENTIIIILKIIYNVIMRKFFMLELIQCGYIDIFQEMLNTSSYKIKKYIVLIIFELLTNNSLTIQVLDLLNIDFFDIIQDFVDSFDESTSLKIFNSFSNILSSISNEEQLAKSMQFLASLSQNQDWEISYPIEQLLLPKDDQ